MQVQFHDIQPTVDYAVGWYEGDSYSGPGGGYLFWEGRVPNPVPGYMANKNGLAGVGVFFAHKEDHVLRWDGSEWLYECSAKEPVSQAVERPMPPSKPLKPEDKPTSPEPKKKPAAKRRGRPKGSKNKARK